MNDNLERLVKKLRDDSHAEEAHSLLTVHHLMADFATTEEALDEEAAQFGAGLRKLAREWATPPATLPPVGATPEQLEESGLHWVLCGGLSVGMHSTPKVWRLRAKDDPAREAQRARDLQRLAAATRLLWLVDDNNGFCTPEIAKSVNSYLHP